MKKDNRSNIILGRAKMRGLSVADLSRKVGIPQSTLYRKLKIPGGLNLSELSVIDSVVHFTDEEILYLVRCR